jgi:hypothetical protein
MTQAYDDAVATLPEVPDLTGMTEDRPEPWQIGWYSARILSTRTVTSRETGAAMIFNTDDTLSNRQDSRNIRLQLEVRRKSDGQMMHTNHLINYRNENLTAEMVAAVLARKAEIKAAAKLGQKVEWGELFGAFMTQLRIGTLQRLAGGNLGRGTDGGFLLSPLIGRSLFVRLVDDDAKRYKEVKEISDTAPKNAGDLL